MGKPNKDKTVTVSRNYADSPVSHALHDLLIEISRLRKKFPSIETDDINKLHADKLVNFAETICKTLHENVLPQFDNHQKPGLLSILKDLFGLRNIKEQLRTRKYALFLDVRAVLPGIIQQLLKTPEKNMLEGIRQALTQDKDKLTQAASQIPGESLDTLFETILGKIEITLQSSKWDLTDKNQLDTMLYRLETNLFPNDGNKEAFAITHPMTFELAECVVRLSSQLPKEIHDLMPFLNPEAFITDLHSGLTGWGVKKLAGYTLLSEHEPGETGLPSYAYKVTKYVDDIPRAKTYDGAVLVPGYMQTNASNLLTEMQNYFKNYADSVDARSELARTQLLQRLVKAETGLLTTASTNHTEACDLLIEFNQTSSVEIIKAIDEELKRHESLLKENNSLQQQLLDKSQAYQSSPVSELLNHHPELAKELQSHVEDNFYVAYSQLPLPEDIAAIKPGSGKVTLIGIKQALDKVITENTGILNEYNQQIQQKQVILATRRQNVMETWKQSVLDDATLDVARLSNQLQTWQRDLGNIDIHANPVVYGNIESLQQAITICEQQSQQRSQLIAKIPARKDIEASWQLSVDASNLDIDHSLQQALTEVGKPVIQAFNSLGEQLKSQEAQYQIRLYDLQSHLAKEQSEREFADHLRTMDLEKIQMLQGNIKAQITQAEEKNLEAQERIKAIELTIADKKSQLKAKTNSELLNEVLEFCTTRQLCPVDISAGNLLKDQTQACNFLDGVMNTITQLHQQHAADHATADYYRKAVELLNKVSDSLNGIKDSKIPFSQIEQLSCVKQWNLQKATTFDDLLILIGQQSLIGDWNSFRSRQDDFGNMFNRPTKDEFANKFGWLSTQLQLKMAEFGKLCSEKEAGEQLIKTLADFGNTLPDAKTQIIQNFIIEHDNQQLEQQRETQTQLATERMQLDDYQQVLSNIVDILKGIHTCKQDIESLATNDKLSCTDNALYKTVAQLQTTIRKLTGQKQASLQISSMLPQAKAFESSLESLQNLLNTTNQTIAKTLRIRLNLNPLESKINELETSYNEILQEYSLLTSKADFATSETATAQITELIARLRAMSASLIAENPDIDLINLGLSTIEDAEYRSKIEKIHAAKNTLNESTATLGQLLLDNLHSRLNQWQIDTQVLSKMPSAESTSYLAERRAKITTIRNQFMSLPDDEEIQRLADSVGRCFASNASLATIGFEKIRLARQTTEAQFILNDKVHANISLRITERSELVDNHLLPKLDRYLLSRQQAGHKIDGIREQLVNTLKLQLDGYRNSGDSRTVIKTIRDNMANVPGLNLQPILNKITVELFESDRKIPADYLNEPTLLAPQAAHQNARAILRKFKATHPKYVQVMCDIYNQVLAMKRLIDDSDSAGQNFHELANKLRYDLDRFVLAHPDKVPTKQAYRQFRNAFAARLHSEDDLNNVHREAWKPIVLNVLIGLATLGIAIGLKALHSKLSTGRCTFFFNETRRQEHIALLDQVVTAPAA